MTETLTLSRKRKRGSGANISVYFPRDSFDVLNHLRELADGSEIRSVSDFISAAVTEKYSRDIIKGD